MQTKSILLYVLLYYKQLLIHVDIVCEAQTEQFKFHYVFDGQLWQCFDKMNVNSQR